MALSQDDKQWIASQLSSQLSELPTPVEFRNLEQLVTDRTESLEREMHVGFDEIHSRFDTQSARLERHG